MTAIQRFIFAATAFAALAPKEPPAAPSAELVAAFRRFIYWQLRVRGNAPGIAARIADIHRDEIAGGYYVGKGDDPYTVGDPSRESVRLERRNQWEAHRAHALHVR